ncbi:hypothetical protein ACFQHW_03885 [Lapidilactobacillus achengensis]|uniref:Uncharacterized protein n=1 Tax=Lapidilactobacillus achengensis TaxID=2486000 RepID=A0ABW1UNE1_9LACO|nr:hypothetical protein [Lapidilactobacillus achengensis]
MAEEKSNLIKNVEEIIDYENGKNNDMLIVKGPLQPLPEFS